MTQPTYRLFNREFRIAEGHVYRDGSNARCEWKGEKHWPILVGAELFEAASSLPWQLRKVYYDPRTDVFLCIRADSGLRGWWTQHQIICAQVEREIHVNLCRAVIWLGIGHWREYDERCWSNMKWGSHPK